MPVPTVDLIVPGCLSTLISTDADSDCPAGKAVLSVLAKSDRSNAAYSGYEATVRSLLDPDGACLRNRGGLRADLMHFETGMRDVVMSRLDHVATPPVDELLAIEKAVNELLSESGLRLSLNSHGKGSLQGEDMPTLHSDPPSELLGSAMGDAVRRLDTDGSGWWARLFTELQMLLHTLPLNDARMAKGLPTVDGFWFWHGLDELLRKREDDIEVICRDSHLLLDGPRNLTILSDSEPLAMGGLDKHVMVIWDEFLQPEAFSGDVENICHKFESLVLDPLLEEVHQGRVPELLIHSCDGRKFSYRKAFSRRFWRRRQSFKNTLLNTKT